MKNGPAWGPSLFGLVEDLALSFPPCRHQSGAAGGIQMPRPNNVLAAVAFALSCLATSLALAVAPQRTFVASYGLDTNPCSLSSPCRGFQAAINAVAAGGEVVALDSGGYGAMEIHKSVSVIVPTGIHAGLSPNTGIPLPGYPGQSGVVLIDILDTDIVVLRGLSINHQGTVTGGVEWISSNGGAVYVENTVVNGFPMEGLYMQAPSGRLFVTDSILRNNGVSLYASVSGGAPQGNVSGGVAVDRTRIENSGTGIRVLSGVYTRLSNSVILANNVALEVQATSADAVLAVDNSTISLSKTWTYYLNSSGPYTALLEMAASSTDAAAVLPTGPHSIARSLGNNYRNAEIYTQHVSPW